MCGVIKKERITSHSRTKRGWPFTPLGALHYAFIPRLQSYYLLLFTVNVGNKRLVILNISFVSHAAIEMVQ